MKKGHLLMLDKEEGGYYLYFDRKYSHLDRKYSHLDRKYSDSVWRRNKGGVI